MRRSKTFLGFSAVALCAASLSSAAWSEEPLTAYEQGLACKFSQTCDPETLTPYDADSEADEQTVEVGPEAAWSFYKPTSKAAGKAQPSAPAPSAGGQAGGPKLFQPSKGSGGQYQSAKRTPTNNIKAPTPKRKPAPAYVRKNAADMTLEFGNASADVNPSGEREIKAWANVLNSSQFAGKVVRIEGHTNAVGAADYNLELSQRRAEAVKQLLISSGVDASRIEAVGLGFNKPRSNDPRADENRRVEIVQAN